MRGGTGSRNARGLTKALSDLLGGQGRTSKRGQSHGTNRRVDIVSENLCDDVIKYLAPTLEQHKGCSLIDIHPGPCLFSSKIHDFLRPKSHILVEPDKRYLEPFIKPLLEKRDSTYRHIIPPGTSPAAQWTNLRKMQKRGSLLPDSSWSLTKDPGKREYDPNVLVIGNLARRRQGRVFEKAVELVPLVMHLMAYDVLAKEGFQGNALIRMLWWLPEMYKPAIVPANLPYNRSNLNVAVDMAFNVSEVAGVTPILSLMGTRASTWVPRKRLGTFDDMNMQAVTNRMSKEGMKVPKGRQLQLLDREYLMPDRKVKSLSPLSRTAGNEAALQAKIDSLSARITEHSTWLSRDRVHYSSDKSIIRAAMESLEYPQCKANHQSPAQELRQTSEERVAVLFDLSLRLFNIEASFKKLEETNIERTVLDSLREEIMSLDRNINKIMENVPDRTRIFIEHLLEDQLAFYSTSPLMAWDRRSYEPLQAQTSDFWPNFEMALLDFTPKSIDLSVPDLTDSRECSRFCSELLKVLFAAKSQPLPLVLDQIGANAGGGRLNPYNVKVQMLTTEMVEGLVKAFFEWPFRPEKWELTLAQIDEGPSESRKGQEDASAE